jgi:anti-sigma B factor antagonist
MILPPTEVPPRRRLWAYNPDMTVVERQVGDVTVLDLKGRLVFEEGDNVLRGHVNRLLEQGRTHLVVNLRDVTYVDSCGIGVLVSKYVSLRRKGGDLRFVHVTPRSHRLLEITKLVDIFRIFDTEDEAVASYSKQSTV